ncbi:MAG: hypothetical protein ACKO24_15950 [Leptolyngbyaceae cyanobacterium]
MTPEIDPQLFDEITQYLKARATQKDREAAQLLMLLKDAEIQPDSRTHRLDLSRTGWYNLNQATTRSQSL